VCFYGSQNTLHIQAATLKIQNGGNNDIFSKANIDILILCMKTFLQMNRLKTSQTNNNKQFNSNIQIFN